MFFGLDLAWADHNWSGACVVEADGTVVDERLLRSDDDILGWVADHLDGPAVVAADIPLSVPNAGGARDCDRQVAAVYGSRHAGPHPANRTLFLSRYGRIRGEDLADRFADLGFGDPWANRARTLLEVYPHPGLVEVFGLPERLAYKKGTPSDRRRGLARLRRLMRRLEQSDPPLLGQHVRIPRDATGGALKAIEDRLDARFCAWAAAVWHRHRTRRVRLFGGPERGHIAVPQAPR